jgi:hypothetical protein
VALDYFYYIRDLVKRVDEDWPGVVADLEVIRSAIMA